MATRNLLFFTTPTQPIRTNTSLLLTFVPVAQDKLYVDQAPVAWKVLKFPANGANSVDIRYTARLAAAVAQIDGGIVQSPNSYVEMALGQTTTYTIDNEGFSHLSEPEPKPAPGSGLISAVNESGTHQDMSIGLISNSLFEPLLAWPKVKNGDIMAAQFTPMLRVYAFGQYKETEIIRGEIHTAPLLEVDLAHLAALPKVNKFQLFEDKNQGGKLRLIAIS